MQAYEYEYEDDNGTRYSADEVGVPVHRFSDSVADILLGVLHRLEETGVVERDRENTWVTTKKWRAQVVMRDLREEQD